MFEKMKEKRAEGGFTLIELLIVIIILAILAAIVVFAVGTTSKNAQTAACQSDAKSLETAMEAYHALVGDYPAPGDATVNSTYYEPFTSTTSIPQGTGTETVGPWLRAAPGTAYYQILFNTSGSIWVTGSATTDATAYDAANDFDLTNGAACANAT